MSKREKIEALAKRALGSTAFQNGIWLYVMQMFNSVIPLLTLPYITRVLGAAGYGVFSKALNLTGYFQVFVEYGFNMAGARKAAIITDRDELNQVFTSIVFIRGIICAMCVGITVAYAALMKAGSQEMICMVCLSLMPIGTVIQQNWLFQGLQKMKYITIISVVSRLFSLVGIFCFVHDTGDIYIYCILYGSTSLCIGLVGLLVATIKIRMRFVKAGITSAWQECKEAWYVFTTSLSSKVFSSFGITMMGVFATNKEVGIFSAIYKIPNIMMLVWSPISQIFYPITSQRMTQSFRDARKMVMKIQRIILLFFLLLSICIAVGSRPIIQILYGSEYAGSYYLAYPLLAWLIFGINNNFLGIQTLLASGHSKEYSKCFQVSVILMIALDVVLIWLFRGIGASMAPAISEFVLGVLLSRQVRRIEKEIA